MLSMCHSIVTSSPSKDTVNRNVTLPSVHYKDSIVKQNFQLNPYYPYYREINPYIPLYSN